MTLHCSSLSTYHSFTRMANKIRIQPSDSGSNNSQPTNFLSSVHAHIVRTVNHMSLAHNCVCIEFREFSESELLHWHSNTSIIAWHSMHVTVCPIDWSVPLWLYYVLLYIFIDRVNRFIEWFIWLCELWNVWRICVRMRVSDPLSVPTLYSSCSEIIEFHTFPFPNL